VLYPLFHACYSATARLRELTVTAALVVRADTRIAATHTKIPFPGTQNLPFSRGMLAQTEFIKQLHIMRRGGETPIYSMRRPKA